MRRGMVSNIKLYAIILLSVVSLFGNLFALVAYYKKTNVQAAAVNSSYEGYDASSTQPQFLKDHVGQRVDQTNSEKHDDKQRFNEIYSEKDGVEQRYLQTFDKYEKMSCVKPRPTFVSIRKLLGKIYKKYPDFKNYTLLSDFVVLNKCNSKCLYCRHGTRCYQKREVDRGETVITLKRKQLGTRDDSACYVDITLSEDTGCWCQKPNHYLNHNNLINSEEEQDYIEIINMNTICV